MSDSELKQALSQNLCGFAVIDAALNVSIRRGALMDWLPEVGASVCQSTVFQGREDEFAALRDGQIEKIFLPGLCVPPFQKAPFTVSTSYDRAANAFLIFACTDRGDGVVKSLLTRERQERLIVENQAKTAGRLAREKEARYRDIVDSATELVLRLDKDFRVTFINPHACWLLDEPAQLLIGRGIDELLPCVSPEEPWARRLKANGLASFEQPLRRCCQTTWIWWSVHWLGVNGGPKEYQAVGRDMTALRRLRAEAARGAEEIKRNAVMRERLRIAHDLHDTLVQSLVALVPQLRLIRKVAGEGADARLIDELARAEAAARDGLTHARAALADLRRQDVEPGGFGSALERLADLYSARTGVKLRLDIDTRARTTGGERAEVLFRIASEALRNTELHADPTSVELAVFNDEFETLTLIVADNGRGFDPEQVKSGHFGLIGMQEQAEMIGASFSLVSVGELGTKVTVVAPAPDAKQNETL